MFQTCRSAGRTLALLLALIPVAGWAAKADPAAAARYYEDGLTRFQKHDVAGAIIQLKNALQSDNTMLAAHLLLARALLENKQYGGAEAAFKEALKMGVDISEVAVPMGRLDLALGRNQAVLDHLPASGLPATTQAEVLAIRAEAYAAQGNRDQALASIAAARKLDPTSAVPAAAASRILLAAGRGPDALAAAREAVKLAPSSAASWNALASVEHAGGRLDDALKGYAKALQLDPDFTDARVARAGIFVDQQQLDQASAELAELARRAPDDPRALYLSSVVAGKHGDTKTAAADLARVQHIVDGMSPEWVANHEQFLMLGALANQGMNNAEKANDYLGILLKRYPRNRGARKLQAALRLQAGDGAGALAVIEPLLRDGVRDGNTLYLAGRAYLLQKRFEKATTLLEQAAAEGGGPAVFTSLGQSQAAEGNPKAAVQNLEKAYADSKGDGGIGLMLAALYMRQGDDAKARDLVQKVVAAHPGDVAALNMLGVVNLNDDPAAARKAFGQALQVQPDFLPARLNLIRMDAAAGKLEVARKALDDLSRSRPGSAAVMFETGLLEERQERLPQARDAFRAALDRAPGDVRASMALIRVSRQLQDAKTALQVAHDMAIRHPNDLAVLEAVADVELAQGDRAGATQIYQDMTKLADYDASAQVRIGMLNLRAGNLDAAAYNLRKAREGKGDAAAVKTLEARIAMAGGRFGEAERIADELGKDAASRLAGLELSADIAMQQRRYKDAFAAAGQILKLAPSGERVQGAARMHLAAGDAAGAERLLADWVARSPQDLGSRRALAEVQIQAGDWSAARATSEALLKLQPRDAGLHNNLAVVLLQLGDVAGALAQAEQAYQLDKSASVLDTYGWALVKSGKAEEGLRFLRDARLKSPDNPEHRYHLAFALKTTGRLADARLELAPLLNGTAGAQWKARADGLLAGAGQ